MAESKVSVYNGQELKSTTDDALGNYLRSLGFKQDNMKTDIKLAVGWTAVVIAAAIFAADYKLGWEATKHWTAVAVAAYAVLNSFFTYWLWFVEKGLIFEGAKDGKKITIRTKINKHDPTYYVDVTTSTSNGTPSTRHIKTPFTTWFTADGFFVAQPFQQWIASSVEAIGDVDLKNAMRDQRDQLAAPELDGDTIHVASRSSVSGNATKRKKKT